MAIATREGTVETFVIEGGVPLSGTVRPAGNKNAALPILAACLLTADPVTLENVPRIRDVEAMIELLVDIGVEVEWLDQNTVRVWAAEVTRTRLDADLCTRIRASILLAGPLLARFGDGRHPAARRRRDRPPPRRYASDGASPRSAPMSRSTREYRLRAPGGLHRRRHVPGRGVRDRHRERASWRRCWRAAHRRSSETPPASRTSRTCAAS